MIIPSTATLIGSTLYLGRWGEEYKMTLILDKKLIIVACIAFSIMIIAQVTIVDTANALTRYFNCVTRAANSNSTFSMDNAETCYDKVFKGALDNDRDGNPLK